MTTVDLIVPIIGNAPWARRCIENILGSAQQTPCELIVVHEAATDPDLGRALRELARSGRLTLLEHPAADGLSGAFNRAQAVHRERDCVLLQSDTEVANDWLDRLRFHAHSARDIGTVAPFASGGGVAGYPRNGVANDLPPGLTVAGLDRLFSRANQRSSVTVPVTFGPCIYMKRECLEAVGILDGTSLGTELGVKQDFALRAASAGFCHLLAADVFVAVGHSVAADADIQAARERAEEALERLYPHYPAQREGFRDADPACPFQRRVDLLRLAESPRHLLLFVSHGWGGGIRRHMRDLANAIDGQCDVLLLEPARGDTVRLSWPEEGEGFALYFSLERDLDELVELLASMGLARVHIHHVHGLPRQILDLPAALGVPYDCTLHDYYAICPQYHLVTADGRYCGEPAAAGCASCLSRRPPQWNMDIGAWRSAFERLLTGAARVIAPSRDVASRIARYFPALQPMVLPHFESAAKTSIAHTRVMTLGTLSPEKGLHVVRACAEDARARGLPLAFKVLGATTEPLPQWPELPLSVHGQYAEEDLPGLVAGERPDVLWLPSQVPETYAYTLSVALQSGVPVVASALGAFPERLSSSSRATLVPWDATPREWNDALLAATGLGTQKRRPFPAKVAAS